MNKRLSRGGHNSTILQRQILRTYLRSVLKGAWTADEPEDSVWQFIIGRKMSLKNLVSGNINLSAEIQNILNGRVEFLTYVEKQWAGDLLHSWSVKGGKRLLVSSAFP